MQTTVFELPLDLLTMSETVAACERLVELRQPAQHVVLNAGKVVLAQDDPRLARIIRNAALVNADGQSIVWAGRILGAPVPERVTGIDLMSELLVSAANHGWPVYFLGARQRVVEVVVSRVRERHPSLQVVGFRDGYFASADEVAAAIRASGARLVFVALPSPAKEYFIEEHSAAIGDALCVGVGGSFDVIAGLTPRAPVWMQRSGLEWLHRFVREPRRMWRRYLVGNYRFLALLMRALRSQRNT